MKSRSYTVKYLESSDAQRLDLLVNTGKKEVRVFFEATGAKLTPSMEAMATFCLLPSMRYGCELHIPGPLSRRWLQNIPKITGIYRSWDPSLHPERIRHEGEVVLESNEGGRVASCYTGGLDSAYTLLKNQSDITDILYVHGYDLRLDQQQLLRQVSDGMHKVAQEFGLQTIEIRTNLKQLWEDVNWGLLAHSAALAGMGHLLSGSVTKLYIGSTNPAERLEKLASRPDIDPLWGTNRIEFIHDGCEADRPEKAARVVESPALLNNLRVCWKNDSKFLNCGRCEKCVRTMLNLHMFGVLDRCRVFPTKLSPQLVRRLVITPNVMHHAVGNLLALRKRPEDAELADALEYAMNKPAWIGRLHKRLRKPIYRFIQKLRRVPVVYNFLKGVQVWLRKN